MNKSTARLFNFNPVRLNLLILQLSVSNLKKSHSAVPMIFQLSIMSWSNFNLVSIISYKILHELSPNSLLLIDIFDTGFRLLCMPFKSLVNDSSISPLLSSTILSTSSLCHSKQYQSAVHWSLLSIQFVSSNFSKFKR